MILIHVLSWRRRPSRLPRAVSVEAGSRMPHEVEERHRQAGSGRHFREIETFLFLKLHSTLDARAGLPP